MMKKKKKNKKVKYIFILLFTIIFLVVGCLYYINIQLKPVSQESEPTKFTVSDSAYGKQVFDSLAKQGIIKDSTIAYYYERFFGAFDFKAGTYEVDKSWDLDTLCLYLSTASNAIENVVSITFKEGEWLKHYAAKIENATNVSADELLALWDDENYIRNLMSDYPFLTEDIFDDDIRYILEGYLFPDTYEFYVETDADTITRKMLNQTLKVYEEYKDLFDNSQYSIHEIFTLASIVQYESSNFADMTKVSSVIYNRLEIGMRLQCSVTICYAIDLEDPKEWSKCEYNNDYVSPYNTALNYGLTPGPINNPGKNALYAALCPEETDYYYFMADVCGDGTVYFSETYAEHNAYVQKYLTCY